MSITPVVLEWVKKYHIRSIVNAPCGNQGDCVSLRNHGVDEVLCLNIVEIRPPCLQSHTADLCYWKPNGHWNAAFFNCIFCTANKSPTGNHEILARNYASWDVTYLIIYDTIGFDWHPYFTDAGWEILESRAVHGSLAEIWRNRAT